VRRSRLELPLLALLVVAPVGCGCGSDSTTTSPPPAASSPSSSAPATAGGDWPTYGGSASRVGVARRAPAAPKLQRRVSRGVDGEVYAQPLIVGGRIYVATENNTLYSFTTGGRLVWKRHLGAPVPGSDLPCGNIDPSGITSTPVVAGGRLYAVAFLRSGHKHVLFGLRLRNGSVAVRANVDPPNRLVEQERGALLAAHGRVYVPYGGLFGDCGPFRGYVVSTTQAGRGRIAYRNPATEAGIWAPAGISAQSGTLLVSTGNGGAGSFGYQNSVIRLSPGLRRLGFWAPRNWQELSAGDVDESSLAPLPVSRGRVFQIGKDGIGHLLRHSLGGVGGQAFSARVCGGGAFGAGAFRAPLAIVPCGDSLYGLRIDGGRFRTVWRSDAGGLVPVVAGGSVFAITRDGTLNQLRVADGRRVTSADVGGGATSFPAPAAAGHTLVAPAGRAIVVFSI
jgi:PQQ-like domain